MDNATKFINDNIAYAKSVQHKRGLHYLISLTQSAQESAWGTKAPGNNFFGVKDTDGVNGNEQLITTTEYSKNGSLRFPVIIRKIFSNGLFKYTIKDYFRKYDSAEIAFNDHVTFFEKNPRYKEAMKYKMQPARFFEEIAKAGYATDPKYADNLKAVMNSVIKRLP